MNLDLIMNIVQMATLLVVILIFLAIRRKPTDRKPPAEAKVPVTPPIPSKPVSSAAEVDEIPTSPPEEVEEVIELSAAEWAKVRSIAKQEARKVMKDEMRRLVQVR